MTSLRDFTGQELLWKPTSFFKSQYELLAGETLLARLNLGGWSSNADADTADAAAFTLQRKGFWKNSIIVTDARTGAELAVFQQKFNGGELQFPDGRTYTWRNKTFWGNQKAWEDANGSEIMRFEGSMTRKTRLTINPQFAALPELSLLAILGMHIIVLAQRSAAATSAAAAT